MGRATQAGLEGQRPQRWRPSTLVSVALNLMGSVGSLGWLLAEAADQVGHGLRSDL